MLAERFDAFLFDLDGVIYIGDELLPGSKEALARLREAGKAVRFLTNSPRSTRAQLSRRLNGMGIEADAEEIVTSGWATASYLRHNRVRSAYVIGSRGLAAEIGGVGVEVVDGGPCEAVVVGADEHVSYSHIRQASRLIFEGARFIATNADSSFPSPKGPLPGTGAIVEAVRVTTGERPIVIGKPYPSMFDAAVRGLDHEVECVAMVGDTPETDIVGAHRAGITAILVSKEESPYPPHDPRSADATIPDLTGLFDSRVPVRRWEEPRTEGRGVPTFHIVDVFAEEKYAGNQLAVVRGAGHLSDDALQKLASEMNYSETTFVISEEERDGGYDVRIFTPKEEVPFAGHPTLGTAYVIRREVIGRPVEQITLNLKAGSIPVTFGDVLWMRQLPPTFGKVLDPVRIARALDLAVSDLDERYPVQEVSTGLPCIVAPLQSLDTLKRCRVDWELYFALVESMEAKAILVFAPEPHGDADLSARFFADYYGVPEDPATGSANGCLAGYLVEHRYFDADSIDVRVEQGYEIGRPSLLYLRAERKEDGISVSVGGKVQPVARGELL